MDTIATFKTTTMAKKEEWKKVEFESTIEKHFNNIEIEYHISSYGRVRKIDSQGNEIKVQLDKATRYYTFYHYIPSLKVTKSFFVHKLVAQAFLPDPKPEQTQVIHLNYNRWNNKSENLQWADKYEKERHAQKNPDRPKQKGRITYSKLNESQVIRIKQMLERKVKWKRIAKQFGISEMQIYRIKTGECWANVKLPTDGSLMIDTQNSVKEKTKKVKKNKGKTGKSKIEPSV